MCIRCHGNVFTEPVPRNGPFFLPSHHLAMDLYTTIVYNIPLFENMLKVTTAFYKHLSTLEHLLSILWLICRYCPNFCRNSVFYLEIIVRMKKADPTKQVGILLSIQEVLRWNLGQDTGYSDLFMVFFSPSRQVLE